MAFGDTGILDDFNRADEGPPPSSNWTDLQNGLRVMSNLVRGNTSGQPNWSNWNASTFGPDCEVFITLTDTITGNAGAAVLLRATTNVLATVDGYLMHYTDNGDLLQIYRIDNGSLTKLDETAFTLVAGDKIGGEAIGSTLKFYIDDGGAGWTLKVTSTDSTYGSAGFVGARLLDEFRDADDFGGGTLAAVGGIAVLRRRRRGR